MKPRDDAEVADWLEKAGRGFAVISRYPGFGSVDEATATRAVGAADQIQEAVQAAFAMG